MSGPVKRLVVNVGVIALLASVISMTGSASASPQVGDEEVPVQILPAPPRAPAAAESAASSTSPGFAGTGATENGIAPEATVVSDGTFEGQPRAGESVIGADGRTRVTNTTVYRPVPSARSS